MKWKNIFIPRKLWQAIKIETKTLMVLSKYGLPDVMLQFSGGLGDELLLSIIAQEFKKRNSELKIWQISPAAELLINNPCYSKVFSSDQWFLRHTNLLNSKRLHIKPYAEAVIQGEEYEPPKEHIVAVMCRNAGIKGKILLVPRVFLTQKEIKDNLFSKGSIVVNYPGEDSYAHMKKNRFWNIEKFQQVIDDISSGILNDTRYNIIQLGDLKDPLFKGVVDLRGKTSLRYSAAILQNCEFFLGFTGFLMHLARSVDCRSVIVYGGLEHSWQSGYKCNENLNSTIECAPCWKINHCDLNRKCMSEIDVDDVIQAAHRLLARKGTPCEAESIFI